MVICKFPQTVTKIYFLIYTVYKLDLLRVENKTFYGRSFCFSFNWFFFQELRVESLSLIFSKAEMGYTYTNTSSSDFQIFIHV